MVEANAKRLQAGRAAFKVAYRLRRIEEKLMLARLGKALSDIDRQFPRSKAARREATKNHIERQRPVTDQISRFCSTQLTRAVEYAFVMRKESSARFALNMRSAAHKSSKS